jgi:hypothetical protein
MRLTAVALLKHNGEAADPFILGLGADLSTFGFFQRASVREMLAFVSRTVAKRTAHGCRQVRQGEEGMPGGERRERRRVGGRRRVCAAGRKAARLRTRGGRLSTFLSLFSPLPASP